MKVVYISGPITAPNQWEEEQNHIRAAAVTAKVWAMDGLSPICPHLNSLHMGGVCPYDKFIEGDLEILARCDVVVMLPDWGRSNGASVERSHAIRLGIPVLYWPADEKKLYQLGLSETVYQGA